MWHVSPPLLTAIYGFIVSCVTTWIPSGMCHHSGTKCHYLDSQCYVSLSEYNVSPTGFTVLCVTSCIHYVTWIHGYMCHRLRPMCHQLDSQCCVSLYGSNVSPDGFKVLCVTTWVHCVVPQPGFMKWWLWQIVIPFMMTKTTWNCVIQSCLYQVVIFPLALNPWLYSVLCKSILLLIQNCSKSPMSLALLVPMV